MTLYIISASALLLMTGAKIRFSICLELSRARLYIEAGLLFGAVKVRGEAVACWFPFTLYVNGKPHSITKRKQKTSLPQYIWNGTQLKELNITLALGIKDDGAASVILAGILREAIRGGAFLLEPENSSIEARPVFGRDDFWMELEGIARLRPVQIICAAIRRKISKMRKGKEYDASC